MCSYISFTIFINIINFNIYNIIKNFFIKIWYFRYKELYGFNRKTNFLNYIENNEKLKKLENMLNSNNRYIDKKSIYE